MVFWSCTTFQLNPKCNEELINEMLMSIGEDYTYDYYTDEYYNMSYELKFYIDNIMSYGRTKVILCEIDILSKQFYVRDGPARRIKITNGLAISKFNVEGWPSLIGVICSKGLAYRLRYAMQNIYERQMKERIDVFMPIRFNLRERWESLTSIFPDMKKFAAKQISDIHVREAKIKGEELEYSREFDKWILNDEIGGIVKYFGVFVSGETVHLGTDGNMYSYQGHDEYPIPTIYRILDGLINCKAISYQSSLKEFLTE